MADLAKGLAALCCAKRRDWPKSDMVADCAVIQGTDRSTPAMLNELCSARDQSHWKAVIFELNSGGAPLIQIGSERWQKSWSICGPT